MSRIGWENSDELEEQLRYEDDGELRGRIFFLRLMVVVVFGMLLGRVVWMQQRDGSNFQTAATDNRFATLLNDAPRGVILDRNGELLAGNEARFNVAITPSKLPRDAADRQAVYERLSLLTGVPITNTVAQREMVAAADPRAVAQTARLATLYTAPLTETLDLAGVVEQLPTSIEEVYNTFSFDPYNPHAVATDISLDLARVIQQEALFMPGVSIEVQPVRTYPTGEYTAKLIGFMGPIPNTSYLDLGYERDDRVGLFGLESSLESRLSGEKGRRDIEVDATGREVRQINETVEPRAGYNLHLTLDYELQRAAHEILLKWLERRRETPDPRRGDLEVEQAAVVAIDPRNGEIRALVSLPTFENNRFATEIPVEYYLQLARNDYQPLFNNAIGGQYPPGSVFKIITGAAALQEGIVSPSRLLDAPGSIVIPNRYAPNDPGRSQRFVCWIWNQFDPETGERGQHGAMNMYSAMANSCDIYFYKVSGGFDQDGEQVDALGIDRLSRYANQFGLGRTQGIELPAEAPGNIPTRAWKQSNFAEPWSTGDDYNTAIGQGFVTATPLQIAQMGAVIANGGFLYRPTLVHHMTDDEGRVVLFNDDDQPVFAVQGDNGLAQLFDGSDTQLSAADLGLSVRFDEEGNYVRPPELLNALEVDREYIDVIAEGMRLVNREGGTSSFFQRFEEEFGIMTAGKTGTAEYCDNIALSRDWCAPGGQIQPAHSWYLAYAPYEAPEIVVAAFIFNGEEGSEWAAPVVFEVLEAYFGVGTYAEGQTE